MSDGDATDPAAVLMRIAGGMRASQALHAAAVLDIAGLLSGGPKDGATLAAAAGVHPGALHRLMRCLVALGVFAEPVPGRFALTALGDRLRADAPRSIRPGVLFLASELRWQCWGRFLHSLRTGEPAAALVLGPDPFKWYADHPEESAIYADAMASFTAAISAAVRAAYDFSGFGRIMDVGGGSGRFLAEILGGTPALTGVLFDLPEVVAQAPPVLARHGITDRCELVGGSFFEAVPGGADACVLKQVLHNWDDDRAAAILAACRTALPAEGTLLVVERVMPERAEAGQAPDAFLVDLHMLVMTPGGRERTGAEFRALLARGGFAVRRIVPTASPFSVIEAMPG